MTARTDFIAHCESLGIHRSLAGIMADQPSWRPSARARWAAWQVDESIRWEATEHGHDFWASVCEMLSKMAKTGECK